jgi:NTE family protein
VREFVADDAPNEVWILRINPQQWLYAPKTNAEIQDRMNELMGNLSLNKELDFIEKVNEWNSRYKDFPHSTSM